jgi:cysteine desulfurase
MSIEDEKLSTLVKATIDGLQAAIPGVKINGEGTKRLPGTVNITFSDVSGEAIMHLLDLKKICISTSSACNSGKDVPSHVLLALGLSEEQAKSSIRISYGKYNTAEEVSVIVSAICDACGKIEALRE